MPVTGCIGRRFVGPSLFLANYVVVETAQNNLLHSTRVYEGRHCWIILAIKIKARTVVGKGEESLLRGKKVLNYCREKNEGAYRSGEGGGEPA